jgi:NAD(P)-dependent dehydrogenase (short-subunit alcohol dehydrogenase family)
MALLENKLTLITGAAQGLGYATALGMAREGAHVIAADLDTERLGALVQAIEAGGGRVQAEAIDVTDRDAVAHWARSVEDRLGAVDVLVNNAGISGRGRIDDLGAPQLWDRLLQVNLDGVFNVTHAFVPALKQTRGNIVNLCSITGFVSGISSAGYVASKGAIRSFTQVLARELAPFGVRVNAVAPGFMLTDLVKHQLEKPGGTDWYMKRAPMGRGGEPDEIVGPILFLTSAMASYVTGVILPVDGGFLSA